MLVKVAFAGEVNVGKTAFIMREVEGTFTEGFRQLTIGLDFITKDYSIGSSTARVQLWDTTGGDCKLAYRRPYFRGRPALT